MSEKPATHVTLITVDGVERELGRYTTSQAARRAGKKMVADDKASDFAVALVADVDAAVELLAGIEKAAEADAIRDEATWPMVQTFLDGQWVDVRRFGKRSAIRKVAALQGKGTQARAILGEEVVAG